MDEPASKNVQGLEACTKVVFRKYQWPVYYDHHTGIVVLHWSRQIGKSFTLAAWAVERLLKRPGRLITVLSNSRENGAEFVRKCGEICDLIERKFALVDKSPGPDFQSMRLEFRIRTKRKTSRVKVLAANPRTARGFSGDLILDEFAFHEDSNAIWEAAEPILASHPDYLCRIASTGNGKHNMFYRMVSGALSLESDALTAEENNAGFYTSVSGFKVSRVSRTFAHTQGVKIYDSHTRNEITPEIARAQALDKRAYDQNYECGFADENLTLLSHELINAAEREDVGIICEQDWSNVALMRLQNTQGRLYVGFDVGRKADLSVITVMEALGELRLVRAILRIQNMRLPDQQTRLGEICRLPRFHRAAIDMTGLGLGLVEYAQNQFGASRIHGINFATTVPATLLAEREGRRQETVRVTEALALELLQCYEDRRLQHPADARLRDDLRKPEKITSPGGRVSIAATRDEAGHADHFWSFALALEAAGVAQSNGVLKVVPRARTNRFAM